MEEDVKYQTHGVSRGTITQCEQTVQQEAVSDNKQLNVSDLHSQQPDHVEEFKKVERHVRY